MPTTRGTRLGRYAAVGQYPRGERVTAAFARELGCTEAVAHKKLYAYPRVIDLTTAALRAYRTVQDRVGLQRFLSPIEAEVAGLVMGIPNTGLFVRARDADSAEDTPVLVYAIAERKGMATRAQAMAALRAIDAERAAKLELRHAIACKWDA